MLSASLVASTMGEKEHRIWWCCWRLDGGASSSYRGGPPARSCERSPRQPQRSRGFRMDDHVLGPRGRTLEEEFFRKEEAKLLQRMRAEQAHQVTREELQKATGITDTATLNRLIAMGLGPQSLTALGLVPLVEVAWASGAVEPEERKLILKAAKDGGLDDPSQNLLASWLGHPPDRALADAWRNYVATLCESLT